MNNLTRTFTLRERILILVLVVVALAGLYFFAVHYPITTRMEEIEAETETLELQMQVAQIRYDQYKAMKDELEEIFAMPADELTVMPEYDNIQTLMVYFNQIFSTTDPTLTFDAIRYNNNIALRTVRFSFETTSYEEAKLILKLLTSTGYRCLMENVSVTPLENNAPINDRVAVDENGEILEGSTTPGSALRVTGTITFYELVV